VIAAPPPTWTSSKAERLAELLALFRLSTITDEFEKRMVAASYRDALPTVLELLEMEAHERRIRKVRRLLHASKLPPTKTFDTLQDNRLPRPLMQKIRELATGAFLERTSNVLAFGLPGTGKTHVAAALGHALVQKCHSVLFIPAFQLVQELLRAKRDLTLSRALRRFDAFELIVLDDFGYIEQGADEIEVLFTFMSERYERRSMFITSNLVFSDWNRIFKNPMTTAAAIDRVVHHSVILEFAGIKSFRADAAGQKQKNTAAEAVNTTDETRQKKPKQNEPKEPSK
jgi:DNA replication protein DnaC